MGDLLCSCGHVWPYHGLEAGCIECRCEKNPVNTSEDELLQLGNDSVVLRAKLRALADEWDGIAKLWPESCYPQCVEALREVLGNE